MCWLLSVFKAHIFWEEEEHAMLIILLLLPVCLPPWLEKANFRRERQIRKLLYINNNMATMNDSSVLNLHFSSFNKIQFNVVFFSSDFWLTPSVLCIFSSNLFSSDCTEEGVRFTLLFLTIAVTTQSHTVRADQSRGEVQSEPDEALNIQSLKVLADETALPLMADERWRTLTQVHWHWPWGFRSEVFLRSV